MAVLGEPLASCRHDDLWWEIDRSWRI